MNREEILLKEFEFCQQQNIAITGHYWLIFGIFMSVITALAAAVLYSI